MSDESVLFEVEAGLARMRLNRPDALNSLSYSMLERMISLLDAIEDDRAVRALLITGEGRAFCAGADLTTAGPSADPGKPRDVGQVVEDYYNPLIVRLAALRVPIVVAVNGAAVGAGMSIALQGDIVVAARSAYFLQAFTKVGLVPDAGATWLLPRLVGVARAKAMMLLAERIPAEEAASMGLIHSVVDDEELLSRAEALARRLAEGPTISFGLVRCAIHDGLDGDFAASLQIEREAQRSAGFTDDYAEGVRAFREKRAPRFTGR